MAKTIASRCIMNDGVEIPIFGLGVYLLGSGSDCVKTIECALQNGYRMIDTAEFYGNEAEVGRAVQNSGLKREEVFVTSKLWTTDGGRAGALNQAKEAVRLMNIGYIDLYLIHAPQGGHVLEAYDALLELKKEGILRSVGVSNFGIHHLEALEKAKRPRPSNNQIELHPWQQKRELVNYCRSKGISVTAYSPLTKGKRIQDPVITRIAKDLNRTNAQVLIRWCIQNDFITIPKSSNCDRIVENSKVFDWSIPEKAFKEMYHLGDHPWSCTWDPTKSGLRDAGLEQYK